jgi:hypothetical protein
MRLLPQSAISSDKVAGHNPKSNFPPVVSNLGPLLERGQMKEHHMKPGMRHPKSTACAVSIVLSMLVGNLQAQQVPIPKTPAEVPGPALGTMTKAYVQMVGRMAYFWGWPHRLCCHCCQSASASEPCQTPDPLMRPPEADRPRWQTADGAADATATGVGIHPSSVPAILCDRDRANARFRLPAIVGSPPGQPILIVSSDYAAPEAL